MDILTEMLDSKRAKQLHSYHTSGSDSDGSKCMNGLIGAIAVGSNGRVSSASLQAKIDPNQPIDSNF